MRHNKTSSNKNTVVFLCHNNIHSRLMQRELIKSESLVIKQKPIEEFGDIAGLYEINLILIDYQTMVGKNYPDLLQAESFQFDFIIYNAPTSADFELLMTWTRLKGILFEDAPIEHLTLCVESVIAGDMWLPRHMMVQLIKNLRIYAPNTHIPVDDLTRREKQILDRMICGHSNQQIANELCVAESTVKTHIYKMYKKLNVSNRRDAIRIIKNHQD